MREGYSAEVHHHKYKIPSSNIISLRYNRTFNWVKIPARPLFYYTNKEIHKIFVRLGWECRYVSVQLYQPTLHGTRTYDLFKFHLFSLQPWQCLTSDANPSPSEQNSLDLFQNHRQRSFPLLQTTEDQQL